MNFAFLAGAMVLSFCSAPPHAFPLPPRTLVSISVPRPPQASASVSQPGQHPWGYGTKDDVVRIGNCHGVASMVGYGCPDVGGRIST